MKHLQDIHVFLNEDKKKKPYYKGLDDEDAEDKQDQIKKQAQMDDDNPAAYKPMPGDKEARKKGKVKTSKHVKSYHELYGENIDEASKVLKFKEHGISDLMDLNDLMKFLDANNINYNQKGQSFKFDNQADAQKAIDFLNESKNLNEGVMSGLHQMAKDVNNADEFVTQFFKEHGDKITKNKDAITWVKSLYKDTVNESLIQEKAEGARGPLDDSAMEKGIKKKADETGVPVELLRIVARRGLAAWKSGHRPGATQQQWAYSRVNSFLTKQPGTWSGADKDVAKEVRDGGHDKKLKKGKK